MASPLVPRCALKLLTAGAAVSRLALAASGSPTCTLEDVGTCSPEDAASLLQTRRSDAVVQANPGGPVAEKERAPLAKELVHAVFTYGAPATHASPFKNLAREDGCFLGLRAYTEDLVGAWDEIKQVDAAAMNNYYPHAATPSVVLREWKDSIFSPCNFKEEGHPEWPQRGNNVFEEWRLHQEDDYTERLKRVTIDGKSVTDVEPFRTSKFFAELAWKSYDSIENAKAVLRKMGNWTLVSRVEDEHGTDTDPVMVAQESNTLECAIVFTGTNAGSELSTSTTQYGTGYCGFEQCHVGYRNELWTITNNLFPQLKPILSSCSKVTCVGHSLGGALCEIFAACANSGHTDDPDFQLLAWDTAKPRRLAEFKEPGESD